MEALQTTLGALQVMKSFEHNPLEYALRSLSEELSLKTKELFGLLRTAVTGKTATPPLFQTMELLGKEKCLRRIEAAIDRLQD